jgi:Uma2 family endonuclease
MRKYSSIRGAERVTRRAHARKTTARRHLSVVISEEVEIPSWIIDLPSFRQWARSPAYPERGKVSFLDGEIWVEVSMEKVIHNLLKTLITSTLFAICSARGLGRVFGDRMMLVNPDAGLSTEPDGLFFFEDSLTSGRVRLAEGADSLEVEGSPDMVLECISKHSVKKDTVILPSLYWAANVTEYWLVDPRPTPATLTIFRRGPQGYQAVRKHGGWAKSTVFNLSFRLRQEESEQALPVYLLESK